MTIRKKVARLKTPAKSKERQGNGRFKPGASGNSEGPLKGYKKAKTKLIEDRLEEYNCDPVEVMAIICNDHNEETSLRLHAAKELASCIYPKRKAIITEGRTTADLHVSLLELNEAKRRAGLPEIDE